MESQKETAVLFPLCSAVGTHDTPIIAHRACGLGRPITYRRSIAGKWPEAKSATDVVSNFAVVTEGETI